MKDLERKYQQLLERRKAAQKIERHLLSVQKEIQLVTDELLFIDAALEKKNKAYERIRKNTFSSFIARLKRRRIGKMNRKLSDYYQLILQRKSQETSKKILDFEAAVLNEKLKQLLTVEKEIEKVERQLDDLREDQRLLEKGRTGKKVVRLKKEIRAQILLKKEMKEALAAGESLLDVLRKISDLFDELIFRDSFFKIKEELVWFDQLDEIRDLFPVFKNEIQKFEREYKEVYPSKKQFRLFHRDPKYKLVAKALFTVKLYHVVMHEYGGIGRYFILMYNKAETKIFSLKKQCKTLEGQLERNENERDRLRKLLLS